MSDLRILKEIIVRKTLIDEFEKKGVLNREESIKTINSFHSFALSKYACLEQYTISSLNTSSDMSLVAIMKIQIDILQLELINSI